LYHAVSRLREAMVLSRRDILRCLALSACSILSTWGACPGGGLSAHDRCWYLSDGGVTCTATCSAKGLGVSLFVADDSAPMVPQLLGRKPSTKQFPWGRLECYVPGSDRYHTAKAVPDSNTGDSGEPGDWKIDVCRFACPCTQPSTPVEPSSTEPYPGCVQQNVVLRHAGAHAIFVDISSHGAAGCWQNDCKHSDKFNSADMGICARACAHSADCTHWTYGEQDGAKKCFLRKSDGGREQSDSWVSGSKACSPEALPDAFVAFTAGQLLQPCDGGKSDACPDMARAVSTWKFAISHLKRATEGAIDANTQQFVNQISADTDAFAAQMSEESFPVVVGNNRQVFNALHAWMQSQPRVEVNPNDASLPNPLRGHLCMASSCFEL